MAYNRIWKFQLKVTDRQELSMPKTFRILSGGIDPDGHICLWAAVEEPKNDSDFAAVEIIIVGTGQSLPHLGDFIGTVKDGSFMWHIFTGPSHGSNASESFHYQTRENGRG